MNQIGLVNGAIQPSPLASGPAAHQLRQKLRGEIKSHMDVVEWMLSVCKEYRTSYNTDHMVSCYRIGDSEQGKSIPYFKVIVLISLGELLSMELFTFRLPLLIHAFQKAGERL